MDLVSIVIPCYNPGQWLLEAVASARAQTYPEIEIVLVNDGTSLPDSLDCIRSAARQADRSIEQANLGLPGARNAGMRAAHGRFVVPLDADDLLEPAYVAKCVAAISAADAAFVYSDCRVFGDQRYVDTLPEYNLYNLLDRNSLTYAALIRKDEWERAGGYDESMRLGYEDWEFWLRLGAANRFGRRVPRVLFRYRKRKGSLYETACAHHAEIVAYIRGRHPELYDDRPRAAIKTLWAPAVRFDGPYPAEPQTIEDIRYSGAATIAPPFAAAEAPALLVPASGGLDRESGELAALAVWAGRESLTLRDGSLALSREYAAKNKRRLRPSLALAGAPAPQAAAVRARYWGTIHRHLANAELLSFRAWVLHPLRSALRLVPLRLKERVNQRLGHPLFDLTFYLRFQPRSLLIENTLSPPLRYCPRASPGRIRVALVTPHLGSGGAETVLLEMARLLPADRFEVLLLATQSNDNAWSGRWRQSVANVYDLARVVPPQKMVAAIYSMVTNWQCSTVVVQNSLAGYAAFPHLRRGMPRVRLMDVVHSFDDRWDVTSVTAGLAAEIDLRVAVSEAVRSRLLSSGTPESRIALVRNGVDLERFRPLPRAARERKQILFAGRLDPIKRAPMLADIAGELLALRNKADFVFAIAGEGPDESSVRAAVRRKGLEAVFHLLGYVEDMPPLIAASDVVLLPSQSEGVPLIVLEALACATPVVASKVGALAEAVDSSCGVLVEPGNGEASAFAAALDRLLDQPDLLRRMGEAGRNKVAAEYDLRRTRQAYASLFA